MALLLVAVMTLPWTLFFTEFNSTAWQAGRDMTAIFKDHYEEGAFVEGIMRGGMSGTVRFFSPVMNTWGTLTLVGGALYSAHLFRRKRILPQRVTGNALIAIGGLLPAFGGLMLRLGDPTYKYLGEMLGRDADIRRIPRRFSRILRPFATGTRAGRVSDERRRRGRPAPRIRFFLAPNRYDIAAVLVHLRLHRHRAAGARGRRCFRVRPIARAAPRTEPPDARHRP